MRIHRQWRLILMLLAAAAIADPAGAQQPDQPAKPSQRVPKPAPKPDDTDAAAAAKPGGDQGNRPKLLGQFDSWGAYLAAPNGRKVCFVIAKPTSSQTTPPNRPRNPAYLFIASRPADKVADEVSIMIGYPFKPSSEATAEVGSTSFALYTQQDGAWIKNLTEESRMIEAMRQGQSVVVKGSSTKGTQSTDTFSLKGLSQALDRADQECKS